MTNLYETDFVQWTEEQAKALREHNAKALDWENLQEEIDNLGKEQINAVHSFLMQIIIHRLKLDYTNEILSRGHWLDEIDDFQDEIERRLTKTLLNKINIEAEYKRAKRKVFKMYNVSLPDKCPYTFADLMTRLSEN
jgi:cell division septum initiation protein DivIVA